jgi:hypothetical protein
MTLRRRTSNLRACVGKLGSDYPRYKGYAQEKSQKRQPQEALSEQPELHHLGRAKHRLSLGSADLVWSVL